MILLHAMTRDYAILIVSILCLFWRSQIWRIWFNNLCY